jgi:uncharacterized protein (TIGR02186 family)
MDPLLQEEPTLRHRPAADVVVPVAEDIEQHQRRRLFADGALVTRTETAFEIVKVGFEQFIATTARQNGLAYGLVTAFMALMTGWMASIVFRKD